MKDTIAAIATAMNHAGIGIVRISGSDAFNIIDRIYESKDKKKKLSDMKSHTIHYGFIKDGEEIIDEVMVLLMRSPNSYTKEDTIEIDCHGGVFVTKKILETVLKYGARLAEPGEFTKRAFLNGRMDLSEAEAVMDVIQSESEYALKNSIRQLKGSVHHKIKEIREKIIYEIAFIESALDDPEHISIDGYGEKLEEIVDNLCDSIKKLLITFQNGRILKEGIQTVIVGKPNAGKSSLLNVLAGEERAIVTDIAGTTRDALEVSIRLSDIHLNIIDTAGIHNTEDIVERIGVEKAKEYAKDADLLLYMADSSVPLDKSDEEIIKMIYNKNVIVLLNKTDLNQVISKEKMEEKVNAPVICISAKEETGIEELENTIKKMFFDKNLDMNHDIFITNVRHKNALEEALNSLLMVKKSIEDGMPEDFYSIDLMNSYEVLGKITGEAVEDDLVNEIFSKFCTGK